MALLFMDSFDHYATADLSTKWTTTLNGAGLVFTVTATGGRRGSGSLRITLSAGIGNNTTGATTKTVAPDATCVAGMAYNLSALALIGSAGVPILSIRDGATAQITVRLNSTLTLSVVRGTHGGTVLGTTAAALSAGVAAYIELKVLVHPSAGTVDLRVNGVSVLSLTAQNTRNTANSSWTALSLGCPDSVVATWSSTAGTIDYDDLYVLDGSGAAPWNTFLGDCRVDARYPTAPGATTAWTPLAGANWAAVDDAAPNDDTDYTATSTVGATDTFVTQDAPVPGATIFGVQHCLNLKKMDAGVCTVAPVIRHSGVDYPGASVSPGTSYGYGLAIAATNPGTGAAWTEAGFNAAEFGYKRTA